MKLLLAAFFLFSSTTAHAFGGKPITISDPNLVVSDSLVKNLQCSTLTEDNVLASLQEDAFSNDKELPIYNWASSLNMGHCWTLSHAQRLFYYLARLSGNPDEKATHDYLEMVKGLGALRVFDAPKTMSEFYSEISTVPGRSLQGILDFYQVARFSSPLNIDLIIKNWARPTFSNEETFNQIKDDVSRNRMPLIILRTDRVEQHVLLVKSLSAPTADGLVNMRVYDSNFPQQGNTLSYSLEKEEFYAPDIISGFGVDDPNRAVGIFVDDEGDMDKIQEVLYHYYSNRCAQESNK